MKQIILTFTILLSTISYSQIPVHHYYVGSSEEYDSFQYKNQYYEARPRGLKTFLDENEMDADLKIILTKKMKKIRNRDLISNISGWGLWATGVGIVFNEAFSKNKEESGLNSSTIFKGLGVAVIGALLKEFIRPKNKHYNDFVNTFNRKQSDKIKYDIGFNYDENLNFGLTISF